MKELVGYIIANGFTTINDFTVAAMNDFDGCYWEIIVGYIGFMDIDGVWCVFHAMVPPTKKFKRELGWR